MLHAPNERDSGVWQIMGAAVDGEVTLFRLEQEGISIDGEPWYLRRTLDAKVADLVLATQ